MKIKDVVKLILLYLSILASIMVNGCSEILNIDEVPGVKERGGDFIINLKDNTGFMQKLFGKGSVPNAIVRLKSNSLGTEYSFVSDSSGNVRITGLISDSYFISIKRGMLPQELEAIFGAYTKDYVLVNKETKAIELSAGGGE